MQISPSDINQFKALYQQYFGVELDDEAARRKLNALVEQMAIIYQPVRKQGTK